MLVLQGKTDGFHLGGGHGSIDTQKCSFCIIKPMVFFQGGVIILASKEVMVLRNKTDYVWGGCRSQSPITC